MLKALHHITYENKAKAVYITFFKHSILCVRLAKFYTVPSSRTLINEPISPFGKIIDGRR
jgi:hypothetical protein